MYIFPSWTDIYADRVSAFHLLSRRMHKFRIFTARFIVQRVLLLQNLRCCTTTTRACESIHDWQLQLTDEEKRLLQYIKAEYELGKHVDACLPEYVSDEHWRNLLKLSTANDRWKYMAALRNREERKSRLEERRSLNSARALEARDQKRTEMRDCQHLYYGLSTEGQSGNTMFLRLNESRMQRFLLQRFTTAMRFAPPIVIDCSYLPHLTASTLRKTMRDLGNAYVTNQKHRTPFNIILANYPKDLAYCGPGPLPDFLLEYDTSTKHFYTLTNTNYLTMFPRDKLVYLTPNSKNDLKTLDDDIIYVLGGLYDVPKQFCTFAKAKAEGITTARFPIDRYLIWQKGVKTFPVEVCMRILLEMRLYNDWSRAFKTVLKPDCYVSNLSNSEQHDRKQKVLRKLERPRTQLSMDYGLRAAKSL